MCYVGMTRAMRTLYLSHAESRRLHGQDYYPPPSRFLRELPTERVREIRARAGFASPVYRRSSGVAGGDAVSDSGGGFQLGQRVAHPKFGEGVVLMFEGHGAHARVQVNFQDAGAKWLVVQYANLAVV